MPLFDTYYVQVRDKETGAEYPVPEERYHNAPDLFEKLDEAPVDPITGIAYPSKPKTSVDEQASRKNTKSGHQAAADKEKS